MSDRAFWRFVFGDDGPVWVEIGPGRGEFLLTVASAYPQRNFFAIERSRRRVVEIQRKLAADGLPNARVVRADASCLIPYFPDASVSGYVAQFPDPWWKRRHHRRRVFTASFVEHMARTLIPGGTIEVVTDVGEYFKLIQELLDSNPSLERVGHEPPPCSVMTSFARKAHQRNAEVFFGLHRRRGDCPVSACHPER